MIPVVIGGAVAVPCTRNPLMRGRIPSERTLSEKQKAVPGGRRATGTYEPRQVRKEAAISNGACVADRSRPDNGPAFFAAVRRRVHNRIFKFRPRSFFMKLSFPPLDNPTFRLILVENCKWLNSLNNFWFLNFSANGHSRQLKWCETLWKNSENIKTGRQNP